ncbi:hypothetical protein [Poseidonibacter antarcticus]|uniref:hypothetical protein n=1 Tax=Poseidonibacter antarcticus TaxID=2478538 RepID=UPI000EF559F8|nr:hypothetical protein [Poseidonibacter antarcticus]
MTQRDMAGFLDIDVKTIRNWRKNKPNLYKIIMQGFAIEEAIAKAEKNAKELREIVEVLNKPK